MLIGYGTEVEVTHNEAIELATHSYGGFVE
jgi:hypothetical protein